MQANQLKRIHPNKKRMTVARGGKRGKTAGRGGKGQSARAGNKRRPEWRDIIKRIPKLRGRGKNSNKAFQERPVIINLTVLEEVFSVGDSVTPTILVEKGVVPTIFGKTPSIKILGEGEVTKVLKISGCMISNSAKEKLEKAGGSVILDTPNLLTKVKVEPNIKEKTETKVVKKTVEKKLVEKKSEVKKKTNKSKDSK